ncbi:MAG: hypothetical protein KGY74_11080, partial [Candidatus Cloacimonetes bacterium]|nr:hypothetical protein [Candidatus Cloacimonadota bacterium]
MKKIIILTIFVLCVQVLIAQTGVDPRYHTYDEIKTEIDSLQDAYPQFVMVDSIGSTTGAPYQEPLPIWAVKLSDNPAINEDEPAVLFVGQCHAEEILGVEITMYMIKEILNNYYMNPYTIWLNNLEIWFVPSINPEGLQVVMDSLDTSFRKNKRDNNNNGIFDFVQGPGNDIDGVDLNRNYSFNWVHGDTLYEPGGYEEYDYYRGPASFSEGGTQAIRDLADAQHFIFSINWHSSRSGLFSEQVFYSWERKGNKKPPDFAVNQNIGETVAGLIVTEDGSGYYEPSPTLGRKGNAQDWFYQSHSTTQLLIECGTSNLQPGGSQVWLVDDTCQRCKVGAYWLLSRTLGYETDASMLTGHVSDSITGEPLEAEIVVEEFTKPYLEPRMSDVLYGRFWRVLQVGSYDIRVKKYGYEEKLIENVVVNNSAWTELDIELVPKESCTINGSVFCDGEPVSGKIIIPEIQDTIEVLNGNFFCELYTGEYTFITESSDCVTNISVHNWNEAGVYEPEIILQPAFTIFSENWQSGISDWVFAGCWTTVEDGYQNSVCLTTNSTEFYPVDTEMTIRTAEKINLNGVNEDVILSFCHKYYIEWINDKCYVEVSTDGDDWIELAQFSGLINYWKQEFISLKDFVDTRIYLRFKFFSDETLVDPGWKIDDIKITSSADHAVENPDKPQKFSLAQNYPNPFSNSTRISFSLPDKFSNDFNLKIFNIKGQLINSFSPQAC